MATKEKQVSKIRKSIQRTLTTARYESIVICDEIEEQIEWTTLDERNKKVQQWEECLINSFKKSHDRILEELNLSHKKAYTKNSLEEKDHRPEVGAKHELDDLESL